MIESLRPVAQKQDITLTLSGQHAVIEGVEQLLQEMVYNLCDNAIKYNISGGSVTVSVWQNGQTVTLSVVDTGIGIPYATRAASSSASTASTRATPRKSAARVSACPS